MGAFALILYGVCVLINWNRRPVAHVAGAFFVICAVHSSIHFEYASGNFLSIAGLTLIPVILCRFLDLGMAFRIRISSLGLVTIYALAWIMVEAGVYTANIKYPYAAVLLYQFGVLNGGSGILARVSQCWSSLHLRYTGRNQRTC